MISIWGSQQRFDSQNPLTWTDLVANLLGAAELGKHHDGKDQREHAPEQVQRHEVVETTKEDPLQAIGVGVACAKKTYHEPLCSNANRLPPFSISITRQERGDSPEMVRTRVAPQPE